LNKYAIKFEMTDNIRDVKKIRIREYPQIKPATSRKRILNMDTRYPWVRVFLILAC